MPKPTCTLIKLRQHIASIRSHQTTREHQLSKLKDLAYKYALSPLQEQVLREALYRTRHEPTREERIVARCTERVAKKREEQEKITVAQSAKNSP